jgi:hypothetical protein
MVDAFTGSLGSGILHSQYHSSFEDATEDDMH